MATFPLKPLVRQNVVHVEARRGIRIEVALNQALTGAAQAGGHSKNGNNGKD